LGVDKEGSIRSHEQSHHAVQLIRREIAARGVLSRAVAAAIERAAQRQDGERSSGLPGHDVADFPATENPAYYLPVRGPASARSEWQLVRSIRLECMRNVIRSACTFVPRVVVIQERLETGLLVAQRIAQRLGEIVARLNLQTFGITTAHFELQGVVR